MNFKNLKTRAKILVGFAIPSTLLLVLSITAYWSINQIVDTNKWVQHTYKVLGESSGIVGSAIDM